MGHIALKCFYRFDVRYQNQFQNQKALGEYSADESSTPVSQSQAYIASPTTVNDASWFLDSGATHHVTSSTDSMNTNSEYSGTGKLALGDGSKHHITHIGHIILPTSRSLHLKNVLMLPSITKNLISISKFIIENDVIVEFDSTCCYIKDKQSRKILLQGVLKDGLYQLQLHLPLPLSTPLSSSSSSNKDHYNFSIVHLDASSLHSVFNLVPRPTCSIVGCESSSTSDCGTSCNTRLLTLWHSRLGHPNKVVLNKILAQFNIKVSPGTEMNFCDACQYGKLHQASFPSTPLHTTAPFQIIHSDVWGPAPHLSLEGYKFYISFVDDYSRYTWIFPLRLKSEALTVFTYFNKMIERQFQLQIQCLQTDWGGEYRKLQPLLQQLGITFRHPCPYTHQQQGRAKRKHRNIVKIGLTLLA